MRRFLSVLLIGSAATMLFRRSRRGQDFMDRMMGNRMGMMRTPRWIRDMGMNMTFARNCFPSAGSQVGSSFQSLTFPMHFFLQKMDTVRLDGPNPWIKIQGFLKRVKPIGWTYTH